MISRIVLVHVLFFVMCRGLSAQDQTALVAAIKAQVQAAGVDLAHGPGECGRFEVTARVAWALRANGAGLVAKFGSQNGCNQSFDSTAEPKYAVDAVMFQDGTFADLLCGGGDGNTPCWNVGPINPALWRPPFDPGGAVGPKPPVDPPVPPVSDLAAIRARLEQHTGMIADLQNRVYAQTGQIDELRRETAQRDADLKGDVAEIKSDVQNIKSTAGEIGMFLVKYVVPAVTALIAGLQIAK